MVLIAAVLIALASAFWSYQPPSYNPPLDKSLYQNYRQHKAKLEAQKKAEAKKKEAQRIAEASPPIQSIEEIDTPILSNSPVINQINQYRQSLGLSSLTEDPALNASSQAWTDSMVGVGYKGHSGYGSEVAGYSCPDRWDIVQAWINSPAHRAVLTGAYTHVGYGESYDGCYYFIAQFR